MLQRKLRVGLRPRRPAHGPARAARRRRPVEGSKARAVLMTAEELDADPDLDTSGPVIRESWIRDALGVGRRTAVPRGPDRRWTMAASLLVEIAAARRSRRRGEGRTATSWPSPVAGRTAPPSGPTAGLRLQQRRLLRVPRRRRHDVPRAGTRRRRIGGLDPTRRPRHRRRRRPYTECDGNPLRAPNDIVFDDAGGFWFTDHGVRHERTRRPHRHLLRTSRRLVDHRGGLPARRAQRHRPVTRRRPRSTSPRRTPGGSGRGTCRRRALSRAPTLRARRRRPARAACPASSCSTRSPSTATAGSTSQRSSTAASRRCRPTARPSSISPTDDPITTNICFGGDDLRTAYITCSGLGSAGRRPSGLVPVCRWPSTRDAVRSRGSVAGSREPGRHVREPDTVSEALVARRATDAKALPTESSRLGSASSSPISPGPVGSRISGSRSEPCVTSTRRPPAFLRAEVLEVFYDDLAEPSVSVPALDFFGVVHGVPASYASALTAANEGLGLECRIPMPFDGRIRLEYVNASDEVALLYYQADVLLGPRAGEGGRLHAMFHRENPTTLGRDLVILDGLRGPGRYLGMTGGVRPFDRHWWGEGEVKVYFDGETEPTICGTGTEDYLGSAWSMGEFAAPESGAPLVVGPSGTEAGGWSLVSYYRWHRQRSRSSFGDTAKVTLQQIGSAAFRVGDDNALARFKASVTTAGRRVDRRRGSAAPSRPSRCTSAATTGARPASRYCAVPPAPSRARRRGRNGRHHWCPRRPPSDSAGNRPVLCSGAPGNSGSRRSAARRTRSIPTSSPAPCSPTGCSRRAPPLRRRPRGGQHLRVHRGGPPGVDRHDPRRWRTAASDGARLVVTGCLAERYGDELADAMPEVDSVAGFADAVPVTLGRKPDVRRWTCCTCPARRRPRRGRT